MRVALRGLTTRGRAFVAAGLTATLCAIVLGQPALIQIGVLVLAVPFVAAWIVGRSRHQFGLQRTINPHHISAGQTAQVDLHLTNHGFSPRGTVLLEEHLPFSLGPRPRFTVDGIGPEWRRHLTYQVRSDLRGRFTVGPLSVRLTDAFGMVELTRSFQATADLVVIPRTVALPAVSITGAWTGAGDNRPQAFAVGSAEDVVVREYRQGDDLRRVHWPSSARLGDLMVRREEQPWQARATIYLDNRAQAHRGKGASSSLETAVTIAASVAAHLSQRGYTVRLITAAGEEAITGWHAREPRLNTVALLEALAVVQPVPLAQPEAGWLGGDHGEGGLTVAVLGALNHQDLPMLRRLQHHSDTALAFVLDVDRWLSASAPASESHSLVIRQGWRAARVHPGRRIDEAWEELARTSRPAAVASPGVAP